MTTAPAASHDLLAHMAAQINQLVHPITIVTSQRIRLGRTRWTAIDHPALLDQLRAAAEPGGASLHGQPSRSIPDSRPPIRIDAIDALATVYTGLTQWHVDMRLPSPPRDTDWQKTALRQLVGAAPRLAPSIADVLAGDVHSWWRLAAHTCGWRTEQLREAQ